MNIAKPVSKKGRAVRVLFVCMGNICRSPSAEIVFRNLAEKNKLDENIIVDSAGTHGYHIGNPPDPRMCAIAEARGYKLHDLKSRMVTNRDFELNDYVLAMDKQNLDDLIALKGPRPGAIPELLMKFSQEIQGIEVPDPYYGNDGDFEKVIDLIESACVGLLDHILTTYQELQVDN